MKQLTLTTKSRSTTGRGAARRLRGEGLIPANIYGHGGLRQAALNDAEFMKLWKIVAGRTVLITLKGETEADTALTIVKEFQRDPLTNRFLHIDFQAVEEHSEMTISVPVHITGEAYGVKTEGGVIETPIHELKVRCLPKDLPEFITADVSALKVGDSLHIRDLVPPAGVKFRGNPDIVVASCLNKAEEVASTAAVVDPAAAAAAPAAGGAAAPAAAAAPAKGAAPAKAAAAPAAKAAPAKK
ncbi:MAG: 50S ribosomal protein L25 [Verrucomicrobiota bacterium]|nr:50S ribosomal protein L25 [Verrucomicrobiota bacterium]